MTFLKTLLLATALSIVSTAAETECPAGWLPNTFHGTKCCSGNMVIDEEGAYCCVYDMRPYKEALTDTAKLYATATTTSETDWSTLENSCIAEVRFTATDYSAQVSSAASKAEATPTAIVASEVTTTSQVTRTTASSTSSGAGSQSSTPTPTSNPAMPIATGQGMLGGAALAAALLML
ncbi:uncharacterized protein PGRI_084960 [Penicillium griseofulvum]|uniref:Uncharacterized protein n=1 Tax=Penicillium patulum TaxID=5078 RepID=A0A135LTD3_PENPA|nr:uncharacterized protein PGRI_084960 [Penicillium griseofulvum]KXG52212.1 hypothetical protein PGRI_084960 [Penicillium griseofulvum]